MKLHYYYLQSHQCVLNANLELEYEDASDDNAKDVDQRESQAETRYNLNPKIYLTLLSKYIPT